MPGSPWKILLKLATAIPAAVAMLSGIALAVSYHVPQASVWLESCRKLALAGHPGEVARVSTREVGESVLIKLFIEQPDGRELVVVCDGPSGKILRTIPLDE